MKGMIEIDANGRVSMELDTLLELINRIADMIARDIFDQLEQCR